MAFVSGFGSRATEENFPSEAKRAHAHQSAQFSHLLTFPSAVHPEIMAFAVLLRIIFIQLTGNAYGFIANQSAHNLPAYIPRIVSIIDKGEIIQPVFGRERVIRDDSRDANNMFKNITLVLENLLKNYENSQLPSHGKGPTVVRTNMLIRSMGPVSELDMDYSMDCYFRQSWRDTRLSFVGPIKSLSLSIKMLERIWRPDTYFYNGKHSYVHTITVPNKLLRISQEGDILYSMRLTIKAKCPMELRNFPMDRQSCPLVLGSYAYSSKSVVYEWQSQDSVTFVPGMTLSQFDLMGSPQKNLTFERRNEEYSILQVSFNLQRNTGYFVIQVYVPCVLIVVLSWVSFWIHREATSDRVGLGITTVLTLSTISLDSRTDLPKVRYATALDWFLLMSFFYCIATLLEFAGVHYFTKVGSGEIFMDEDEWEEVDETDDSSSTIIVLDPGKQPRRRSSLICPIYNDPKTFNVRRSIAVCETVEESTFLGDELCLPGPSRLADLHVLRRASEQPMSRRPVSPRECTLEVPVPDFHERLQPRRGTVEQQTQTEKKIPRWRQFLYCLIGDDTYRRQRQREAAKKLGKEAKGHVNSVSRIDTAARILFPLSFTSLNIFYWYFYLYSYKV